MRPLTRPPRRSRRGLGFWALLAVATVVVAGCTPTPSTTSAPTPAAGSTTDAPSDPTTPVSSPTASTTPTRTPTPTPTPTAPTPTPTPTTRPTTTAAKPVIVIDPGHSGRSIRSIDRATGLRDIDYPNYPEIYEMFDVSACVARGLRLDGYRVVLTKKKALDSVGLAARARLATRVKADLAISVHDDHGQTAAFQATYDQRGVAVNGRYPAMYRGTGAARTVFDRPAVAVKSQRYARILARARAEAQHRPVSVRVNSYTGRAPLEPGNLALVQLLTTVPWVYNEMGAKTGGSVTRAMSVTSELGYARGLLIGIERSVPVADGVVAQPSAGTRQLRSCLVEQVEPTRGHLTRPRVYLPAGF